MTLTSAHAPSAPAPPYAEPRGPREPHLGDYLALLRRYWQVIAVALLVALLSGTAIHLSSPARYKARIDVVVIASSLVTSPTNVSADVSIDSAVQILLSDRVLGETARALDYPGRSSGLLTDMTISPLINSRILRLYVTSPTPEMAYSAVTLLVQNFLEVRQAALLTDRDNATTAIQAQLTSLQAALDLPLSSSPLNRRDPTQTNRELVAEQNRLQTQLISLTVNNPAPGYISHEATLPTNTVRSGGYIVMGSAAGVGLLLGCFTAAILDRRRQRQNLKWEN